MLEKKALSAEQIDAQAAFELPDREMMALVNITLVDVLSGNEVAVQVPIGVAANVCGVNAAILADQLAEGPVECAGTVEQLPRAFQ